VVDLQTLATTSVQLAQCLNTLVHVAIMPIADLVSMIPTKDVFGAKTMEMVSAKSQTLPVLSL